MTDQHFFLHSLEASTFKTGHYAVNYFSIVCYNYFSTKMLCFDQNAILRPIQIVFDGVSTRHALNHIETAFDCRFFLHFNKRSNRMENNTNKVVEMIQWENTSDGTIAHTNHTD